MSFGFYFLVGGGGSNICNEMTVIYNNLQMLQTAAIMFSEMEPKHQIEIKQLLIILSDGRGVFSEGETVIHYAVILFLYIIRLMNVMYVFALLT